MTGSGVGFPGRHPQISTASREHSKLTVSFSSLNHVQWPSSHSATKAIDVQVWNGIGR